MKTLINFKLFLFYSDIYRSNKLIGNFQQLIDNLFLPLFEATNNPEAYPELHCFLKQVIVFALLPFSTARSYPLYFLFDF